MGVKSTVHLTRGQAEEQLVSAYFEILTKIRLVGSLTDTQLEDQLESINDLIHGGEGFENYLIVSEGYKE